MNNINFSKPICTSLHNSFNYKCPTIPSELLSNLSDRENGGSEFLLIYISGPPAEWFSSNMSHFAGRHLYLPFCPV